MTSLFRLPRVFSGRDYRLPPVGQRGAIAVAWRPDRHGAGRYVGLFVCLTLGACAERPDVASRIDPAALSEPGPVLMPLSPVLAAADGIAAAGPVAGPPPARLAALRARAAGLRGPVVGPAVRAAMAAAGRRAAGG